MIKFLVLNLVLVVWIVHATAVVEDDDQEFIVKDDMIIVEAASPDSEHQPRDGRQLENVGQPSLVSILSPPKQQPCLTSKGKLGICMSVNDCYPYFKFPNLPSDLTWVTGMYDTCSYPSAVGRQVFGVCCNDKIDPDDPVPDDPKDDEDDFPIEFQVNGECGKRFVRSEITRIVQGQEAIPNEFPFMAGLLNKHRQFCGGSLIDKNHILTAAHCVAHMSKSDVQNLVVVLGIHNIKGRVNEANGERQYRVKRVIRHKQFSSSTLHNDVAILTLENDVDFNEKIQPICLPSGTRDYANERVTVSGWGTLKEGGRQPDNLNKVDVEVWDNPRCKSSYGKNAPGGIQDHMLCASLPAQDSCSGDSGGPLFHYENGAYEQIGIVSWGVGCARAEFPGVYTRVTELYKWIAKIVNKY